MTDNLPDVVNSVERAYPLSVEQQDMLIPDTIMPRIAVAHALSPVCIEGKISEGSYFIGETEIGPEMHAVIVDRRIVAHQFGQEGETWKLLGISYNPDSQEFNRIRTQAMQKDNSCGFGLEALVYVYALRKFGSFFFTKWYLRGLGKQKCRPQNDWEKQQTENTGIWVGGILNQPCKWIANKQKAGKGYFWMPKIEVLDKPLAELGYTLPDKELVVAKLTDFLNPPEPETVEEKVSR